jgi:hypothetical protein
MTRRAGPALPAAALLAIALLTAGCGKPPSKSAASLPAPGLAPAAAAAESIRLAAVQKEAGIDFRLGHGGRSPLTILETSGGGCAFLDYDQDEWPDVLLVGPRNLALFHNERNGKFRDVTAASGLPKDRYWMGCAVGDYDGDGRPDLFLTGYRCFGLFRNAGGGRFVETTAGSGLSDLDWTLSAAFADIDLDGDLDLCVGQYLHFGEKTPQVCRLGDIKSACGPEIYDSLSGRLYLNDGRGRFAPFAGQPWKDTGKTWGALVSHLTDSPRPAIYLANDMVPGDLWVPSGKGYRNDGPASGTAFDAQGHIQGGMGVDSGDYDNDGKLDLLVTTFFTQPASLYHNDGGGMFTVTSGPTGIGAPTMALVGFGTAFVDLDNDGWLDVPIANGHVRDNIHDFDASQSYPQPIQLFRNQGGKFTDCSTAALSPTVPSIVGRGLSVGDYNRDGRPDLLVCDLEGEALLLENRSAPRRWLDVRLRGKGGNRFGLGARVTLEAGAKRQLREIKTCGSVLSAFDPVAHFGLAEHAGPVRLSIEWPKGGKQTVTVDRLDRTVTVTEEGV